jgi:MFS family permease
MLTNTLQFFKNKPVFAVGFLFAVSSLLFGTWVAAIPGIKQKLQFTDSTLGLSFLLGPAGAITGMLLSTKVFNKVPVGKWMFWGYLLNCALMIVQVNSPNRWVFWSCLYANGMVSFLNGVSSNTTVTALEKKEGRLWMSTCHGMYSMGGALSAGLAGLFFAIRVPSSLQIIIIVACILVVMMANKSYLFQHQQIIHSNTGLQLPNKHVLGLSFICLVAFMAEGCVADWSAIYMKEVLHAPAALMSMGYVGFSAAMTMGRLNGDRVISSVGSKKIVLLGCSLAAVGFLLVATVQWIPISILGYILIGIGCSCTVPVLFSASAAIPGVSVVEGFAMVTTGGLIGFLAGPSVIGFLAEKSSLPTALSLLIIMLVLAFGVAWRNQFLKK